MAEEKHSIRNAIIATVIGGLILTGIDWFKPFIRSSWAFVIDVLAGLWNHLTSSIAIPWWIFYLLIVCALLIVIAAACIAYSASKESPSTKEPDYHSYREDRFDGVIWRWSWSKNNLRDLRCYCPRCDTQLVYYESYPDTSLHCETCNKDLTDIEGGTAYLMSRITRQIDRKLRSGEWKRLVTHDS